MRTYDCHLKNFFGYGIADVYTKDMLFTDYLDPQFPLYVAQSRHFKDELSPVSDGLVSFCGHFVIDAETQIVSCSKNVGDMALSISGFAFGSSGDIAEIKRFITDSDKRPIYMGWGSMICTSPECMVEVACKAAMISGERAIIQGGWAKLSLQVLERSTDDEKLLAYTRQNVLFVGKAPHEWLFPQCSCTIHHGGSGTISTAIRAGVPTIVTPVFLDQYDHARVVNRLGIGKGFENKQFQKISGEELGIAIKALIDDEEIKQNAKDIGLKFRCENGVSTMVEAIDEFWKKYVETERFQGFVHKRLRMRTESCFWCGL